MLLCSYCGWKPCPEEKGIKTIYLHGYLLCSVGNLALKKKGLRPGRLDRVLYGALLETLP